MPKSPLITHHLRLLFILGVFCISLFMFNLGLLVAKKMPDVPAKVAADKMLFVQEIQSGEARRVENDFYAITVKNSHPRIVYFSEAPIELVGSIPLAEYKQIWESIFLKQNPTAALVFDTGDANQTVTIMELQSAEIDEEKGEVMYMVRVLHIDETRQMLLHRDAAQFLPEKFDVASLFIDAYRTPMEQHIVK